MVTSRKIGLAIGVIVVAAVAIWLAMRGSPPPPGVATTSAAGAPSAPDKAVPVQTAAGSASNPIPAFSPAATSAPASAAVQAMAGAVPVASPSPAAAASSKKQQADTQAAMIDLDLVHHMITDYHTLMGENPVGTNAEIMRALMGHNPHQATLGPPAGASLNDKNELIDRWGTPYFFHQLSRDAMEIRSAGPDQKLYTADDVVLQ